MTGNALYDELDRLRGVVSEQIEEIFSLKGEINDLVVKQTCRSEYEDVGASIGVTVAAKQKAYGDSFGKAGGLAGYGILGSMKGNHNGSRTTKDQR